jgi:Rrf2 family iron-sulfur cluster assembly transcriptional regulator
MPLFNARVDYALRALMDLAVQPPNRPAQSREVAARQRIPESYLNQLLVLLRRQGLVRSVRGAAGGYALGREPHQITLADLLTALHGEHYLHEPIAAHSADEGPGSANAWVAREVRRRIQDVVRAELERTTLAELVTESQRLDAAQSLMLGL